LINQILNLIAMNKSRRTFLKESAIGIASASVFSNALFASVPLNIMTGIQLYSVRDDMKKDPLGTLKQLSEMGYKYVEHANYKDRMFYGHPAADFKKILADLGMQMPSGHTVMGKQHWDEVKKDFTDEWKHTVEDAATAGQKYVISPWFDENLRKTEDGLKQFLEVFNKSGELCKKSGMKFGYHNHAFEFSQKFGDQTVYDIILKQTDPALVIQQLDIGNLYNGGAKAIDVVKKYPGRFESMHVKDEILSSDSHEKYESTILGTGIVGTKEVIELGRKSGGTVHYIIEQESYQKKTPLESAKEDLAIMKNWGF
jgi:sugar phosphate isomerase/epimerase